MLSLELVKEHLRLDIDYCDEDALLLSYIKAAKRRVETYTRRTLITSDESVENKELRYSMGEMWKCLCYYLLAVGMQIVSR